MKDQKLVVLGVAIVLGLSALGFFLRDAAISFKQFERTVTVKGLAEQEHPADVVIWPIQYTEAGNTLDGTYTSLESKR